MFSSCIQKEDIFDDSLITRATALGFVNGFLVICGMP